MRRRILLIPLLALLASQLACVQDCIGSTFSIAGHVQNEDGQPVPNARIHAAGPTCFEAEAFDFVVVTDAQGAFETESLFRFACCPFDVTVSAAGYPTQTHTFYSRGEDWPNEIPEDLIITLFQYGKVTPEFREINRCQQ